MQEKYVGKWLGRRRIWCSVSSHLWPLFQQLSQICMSQALQPIDYENRHGHGKRNMEPIHTEGPLETDDVEASIAPADVHR